MKLGGNSEKKLLEIVWFEWDIFAVIYGMG